MLQGPTSTYNQDGDRLQQLQQQQLQQQRIVDVEVVRGPVASSPRAEAPTLAGTEAVADLAASPSSQDLTGLSSIAFHSQLHWFSEGLREFCSCQIKSPTCTPSWEITTLLMVM